MIDYVAFARTLPNQQLSALTNDSLEFVAHTFLPRLVATWNLIEQVTGYKWKATSYIRQSPNHQYGVALDLAPDLAPASELLYSVHSRVNPFLYKRGILVRKLQKVIAITISSRPPRPENVIIVVECDHLHLQLMNGSPTLVKWKAIKPIYSNSVPEHDLPMIN